MSQDLKLDPITHDLALSRGLDLVLIDGAERIAQQVKVTLLTFLGEWFLDTTFGIPYLDYILIKNPSRSNIENILRQRIMNVPGVTAVPTVNIQIDPALRTAAFEFPDMETTQGIITVAVISPTQ